MSLSLLNQFSEIIVPTMETVRQSYFLQLYLAHETPQVFVGPTGTGKSAITNSFLIGLPKEKSVLSIYFAVCFMHVTFTRCLRL